MCIFSQPVKFVSDTGIFARAARHRRQYLAYHMKVGASRELAMILPLPVAPGTPENAVHFINLEHYPTLFDDLMKAFEGDCKSIAEEEPGSRGLFKLLRVEQVGSFVASFVPTVADFARLDPRFRLPETTWSQLPHYAKYGFAVFQLKKGTGRVHPMAFTFPTARPDRVFFPTVHIHDGKVHPMAKFDHILFAQAGRRGLRSLVQWEESSKLASSVVDIPKASGLVSPNRHMHRRTLSGMLPNVDTWLRVA